MNRDQFRESVKRRLREAAARAGKVTPADLDLIVGDADEYAAHVAEEAARRLYPAKPATGRETA